MDQSPSTRLDKWLWATRLYKTRSQATEACRAGHVKIGGQSVKPAHIVRPGEILSAQVGDLKRTVKVLAPLEHRLGAKLVNQYLEDLTPPEEYARQRAAPPAGPVWPKGLGRPTKRDRRQMEQSGWGAPEA